MADPRYSGNLKHEWRIGETTDGTEQAMALARALLSTQEVRTPLSIREKHR
jgi:hypothetical protein